MPHIGYFPVKQLKPFTIYGAAFVPATSADDWGQGDVYLKNLTTVGWQIFYAAVYLPQGARVTKVTLYGYRDDPLASMILQMNRISNGGGVANLMAEITADWTGGDGSGFDDTIDEPVIDNENNAYQLSLELTPNADVTEVQFNQAKIDWS